MKYGNETNMPTIIFLHNCQGEDDEYGSQEQVIGIINQVSGKAIKLIIPSVGHTPHKEAKELILKSSASFRYHTILNHASS
jgi:hypothetical protein